jgi:hypothetical protein
MPRRRPWYMPKPKRDYRREYRRRKAREAGCLLIMLGVIGACVTVLLLADGATRRLVRVSVAIPNDNL